MGIYYNMLREEDELMGNTGFDQGAVVGPDDEYTVQLNDIAKAVDDINDAYADESKQKELDGQDLESNPVEECTRSLYESEHNWNLIYRAMGEHEIHEAARGNEVIMEAVDIKAFFTKVKDWFVKKFHDLTDIVKKWIASFKSKSQKDKSFVSKYADKIRKGAAAMDKEIECHDFKSVNLDIATQFDRTKAQYQFATSSALKRADGTEPTTMDKIVMQAPEIRGTLADEGKALTSEEFTAALKEKLMPAKVKMAPGKGATDPQYVIDVLSGKFNDVQKIMAAYNAAKKGYNDLFKALKAWEKACQSSGSNEEFAAVNKTIADVKEVKNAHTTALCYGMKFMAARKAQCLLIANKYIAACPAEKKEKAAKPEAKQENARLVDGGFLAGLSMI